MAYVPITGGYKQITALNTVKQLSDTTPIPTTAVVCLVQAETQAVRWTDDGSNPSGTVGTVLAAGASIILSGRKQIVAFKVIESAASAKLNVTFYKN